MENPGYIALSRQVALTRQLDVTANNIANIDAVAFKRQGILFAEHLLPQSDGSSVAYVEETGTVRDLAQGMTRVTGRPLDLAIVGEGYFSIETPAGVRYTRNGQFQLGPESTVVNRNGYPLLDEDDKEIKIPRAASEIEIRPDGAILADRVQVAKLELQRFENQQSMVHTADGLLRSDFPPEPDEDSTVLQKALESSNVNAVSELVTMIQIQRDYQGNHKMLKSEHDRLMQAIRELGSVDQS